MPRDKELGRLSLMTALCFRVVPERRPKIFYLHYSTQYLSLPSTSLLAFWSHEFSHESLIVYRKESRQYRKPENYRVGMIEQGITMISRLLLEWPLLRVLPWAR